MKQTPAGQRLIAELDAELAASAARAGRRHSFSTAERHTIALAADALDRRAHLAAAYDATGDTKERIKLAREIRLTDMAVQRLLLKISTEAPKVETLVSVKARKAANARWHKHAN